eukprot:1913640-Alexandrium_andersonii.AAC.1
MHPRPCHQASAQHRIQSRGTRACCQDPSQTWRPAPNRAASVCPLYPRPARTFPAGPWKNAPTAS